MRRRHRSWNTTHGWDLLGRPRDVIPRQDAVFIEAWGRTFKTHMVIVRNLWNFVGSDIDQGVRGSTARAARHTLAPASRAGPVRARARRRRASPCRGSALLCAPAVY